MMASKADAMQKKAAELQEQAKQLRAEARKQKRKEEREAKQKERDRIQRDAVKLIEFSKQVPLRINGNDCSVYDFLIATYERSKNQTNNKETEGDAADAQQHGYERQGNESKED